MGFLDERPWFPPIGFLEWRTTVDRDRSDIIGRIGAAVGSSGEQPQRASLANEGFVFDLFFGRTGSLNSV